MLAMENRELTSLMDVSKNTVLTILSDCREPKVFRRPWVFLGSSVSRIGKTRGLSPRFSRRSRWIAIFVRRAVATLAQSAKNNKYKQW